MCSWLALSLCLHSFCWYKLCSLYFQVGTWNGLSEGSNIFVLLFSLYNNKINQNKHRFAWGVWVTLTATLSSHTDAPVCVCGSGRLAETTLFLSLSQILLFYCDDDDDFGICCCCCDVSDNDDDDNDADDDCGECVCVSVFCLILRFLFLSWRLDFSHTEAIRPTGKLRYFTERERIHVFRDFQFQLRFLPIYDNTLCATTYFYWFKVRQNSYSQRKCQLIFAFYLPRIPDCFCKCVWVCVRVWAEKKHHPKESFKPRGFCFLMLLL